MKSAIINADRMVLNLLTAYIQKWVSKREFKLHKIDFMIRYEYVQLAMLGVLAIAIPAMLFVAEGQVLNAMLEAAVWTTFGAFEWYGIQMTIQKKKPAHDYLFSLRENPEYNKIHKEILKELFEDTRRVRLTSAAAIVGITTSLLIAATMLTDAGPDKAIWAYLFLNAIANQLKGYIPFVNDFDEPKKKKKALDALSELVARLWGEFIGGLTPQPAFQKI